MNAVPFYLDWNFWVAFTAALALVLSQIPPIYSLLRRGRLHLEAYDRLMITHTTGNPNAQLHLIISNHGGRSVRVRSISLNAQRVGDAAFTLISRQYYQSVGDTTTVLLTPFTLQPNAEWAHIVNFVPPSTRQDEQRFRQLVSNLRADIQAKRALPENADVLVEAEANTLNPVVAYFNQKFKWESGEYTIEIAISTDDARTALTKRYRITLFESDTAELRSYAEKFKYGLGVYYFNHDQQPGTFATLTEV